VPPEFHIGFRQVGVFVAVPETAVDENDDAIFLQNNVGGTWKFFAILPIPISVGEQETSHYPFRLRVFGMNAGHNLRTLLLAENI